MYSDALKSYEGLEKDFTHQVIDHAEAYVDGQIHTNNRELLEPLEAWHQRYLCQCRAVPLVSLFDEQAFRCNNRLPMSDKDRFSYLVRKVVGKRLTYAELTGKAGKQQRSRSLSKGRLPRGPKAKA